MSNSLIEKGHLSKIANGRKKIQPFVTQYHPALPIQNQPHLREGASPRIISQKKIPLRHFSKGYM